MAVTKEHESEMLYETQRQFRGGSGREAHCRPWLRVWRKRGLGSAVVSRVGRQRGVASVETIMAMAILVLLWAGAKHIALAHVVSLQAKAEARECAWMIASGACRDVPAHCESREEAGELSEGAEELGGANEQTRASGGESDAANDMVDKQIEGVFKRRIRARSSRSVGRSLLFDDRIGHLERSYSLPCNTKPMNPYTQMGELNKSLTDDFRR